MPETLRERKLRNELHSLSDGVLVFLHELDFLMQQPSTHTRGKQVAQISNALDLLNDRIRYTTLGVDFRKDDKKKVVAKLRKEAAK